MTRILANGSPSAREDGSETPVGNRCNNAAPALRTWETSKDDHFRPPNQRSHGSGGAYILKRPGATHSDPAVASILAALRPAPDAQAQEQAYRLKITSVPAGAHGFEAFRLDPSVSNKDLEAEIALVATKTAVSAATVTGTGHINKPRPAGQSHGKDFDPPPTKPVRPLDDNPWEKRK